MEPKDMTNDELIETLREAAGDEEFNYKTTYQAACEIELRLNEADALRKENAELRKDKARLDCLDKYDNWINMCGPYDLPEYEAGSRYGLTMRDAADKLIANESEASHE